MKKKVMAQLEKCYSIAQLTYQGEPHILVAAEKHDRCILFDAEGNEKATVWEEPGGVMTMVQAPGKDGVFLATHEFYSPNDSKHARLVMALPDGEGSWTIRRLCSLPFVHRFDILKSGDAYYLIACTLKSDHEYRNDWRTPGKVYGARLPKDITSIEEDGLRLEVLKDGMLRNHGYYKVTEDEEESARDSWGMQDACPAEAAGKESSLVCSENGVFRFYPPGEDGGAWRIEQLLDTPASDVTMIDLDGDGKKELVVMAPFHGDALTIYRENADNTWESAFEYPEKMDFLHAIWSGTIGGRNVAVIGHRKGCRRLLALYWDGKDYNFRTLDDNCGPANVLGYHYKGKDFLIAANRETDEIAMYTFEEGEAVV